MMDGYLLKSHGPPISRLVKSQPSPTLNLQTLTSSLVECFPTCLGPSNPNYSGLLTNDRPNIDLRQSLSPSFHVDIAAPKLQSRLRNAETITVNETMNAFLSLSRTQILTLPNQTRKEKEPATLSQQSHERQKPIFYKARVMLTSQTERQVKRETTVELQATKK